ncbi:modular serine protease-like [Rhopalosiphum maidis]|uniref:modular serine protease-like n=1 Tax=Rhopalosiphum maidis TaxID=43146 RepID=UPI000EFE8DE5|nr:modular serine protease-like [Rhopalosiphum maidis]
MKSTYTFNLIIYSCFILGTVVLCDREFKKRQTKSCNKETEYTCGSGQCIDITSICDGLRDCIDGSDETKVICGSTMCPTYAFKCTYGACINVESICDGVEQCFDGSDEKECTDLISPPVTVGSVENSENITMVSTTTESVYYTDIYSIDNKTCVIPNIEGTEHFFKDSIQNIPVSNGAVVDPYRIVEVECEEGYYKTIPYKFMVCSESGQWKPFVSNKFCLKKCPPMVSDILDIKCSLNGYNVNCSTPSEPGTILTQSCKVMNSHHLSKGQEITDTSKELLCLKNAEWNGQLLTTCTSRKELIPNKMKESSVTAPWNVEIYKINSDGHYYRTCGGTLIAPNLVISAAHCFWKKGLRRTIITNENNNIKIAVGKETNYFSVIDNKYTQFIDIKSIYLKERYDGSFGMYADDISIIVLATNIAFSNGVLPASIDWSSKYSLSNGDLGKMFGLGINNTCTGENKSILKLYTLSYIDHSTCRQMYRNGFENYITRDKVCTDYKLVAGEKNLLGFGGSGLIFEQYEHNMPVQFLTGVLSIKDLNSMKSVAVFTSIQHHIQWIRNIYLNHGTKPIRIRSQRYTPVNYLLHNISQIVISKFLSVIGTSSLI